MLAILQAPKIDVAPDSWVRGVWVDRKSTFLPWGRAVLDGYGDLDRGLLPKGDEEVRVWIGTGTEGQGGVILRRREGVWTAVRLLPVEYAAPKKGRTKAYAAPKDGWPTLWRKAEALGLWTLPDDSTLPPSERLDGPGGTSFIVEFQREGRYRAYSYTNANFQTAWPTAAKMVAIGKLLDAEFPSKIPRIVPLGSDRGSTMGTMLALLQAPADATSRESWARSLLAPSKSVRGPLGLAAWAGFGDLRRHALPKGDREVRVWNGFGITNLIGVVLRQRSGVWTATRLIGGLDDRKHPSSKVVYTAPVGGWPTFWRRAEALGVWSLPDQSALPQEDRQWVADGFSTLVETAQDGRYRAYAYDNPDFQKQWPEAGRVIALNRLTDAAFPFPKTGRASGL